MFHILHFEDIPTIEFQFLRLANSRRKKDLCQGVWALAADEERATEDPAPKRRTNGSLRR